MSMKTELLLAVAVATCFGLLLVAFFDRLLDAILDWRKERRGLGRAGRRRFYWYRVQRRPW